MILVDTALEKRRQEGNPVRVGVVGAGTMGAQIAQVSSFAGIPVVLADVNETLAQHGVETIRKNTCPSRSRYGTIPSNST
jgi:3-hydroxyacyl-CoA dehydrogenase